MAAFKSSEWEVVWLVKLNQNPGFTAFGFCSR